MHFYDHSVLNTGLLILTYDMFTSVGSSDTLDAFAVYCCLAD